jgi:hypothetical protein
MSIVSLDVTEQLSCGSTAKQVKRSWVGATQSLLYQGFRLLLLLPCISEIYVCKKTTVEK